MREFHRPVLLNETLQFLDVLPGHRYIDATLGGGGHTEAIIEKGGRVLGLDIDQNALKFVSYKFDLKIVSENPFLAKSQDLTITQANFRNLKQIVSDLDFTEVDGVLFDLGVSSYQLDTADYGLSFNKEAPLDMRLDKSLFVTAADLVNSLSEKQLSEMFEVYGEEKAAKKIASRIVKERESKKIETTTDLARIVEQTIPRRGKIHPATKIFQALRIVVNSELKNLEEGLQNSFDVLSSGGKLVVISFHSLEDRVVKRFMKETEGLELITKEVVIPTNEEIFQNPRSRSAKLRVAMKQ